MMLQLNEHVKLDLPSDFEIKKEVKENGENDYSILCDPYVDENGEKKAKLTVGVGFAEGELSQEMCNIKGNFHGTATASVNDFKVLFLSMKVIVTIVIIEYQGNRVGLHFNCVSSPDEIEKQLEENLIYLNTIIKSIQIDGINSDMEEVKSGLLLNANTGESAEIASLGAEFPTADPQEKQHTHLDYIQGMRNSLGIFGNSIAINQNGTEYEFVSIAEMPEDKNLSSVSFILKQAKALDVTEFALSDRALEMSRVFRVHPDVFNSSHDREQEIRAGLVQHIVDYNLFRSFAWTLASYCKKMELQPDEVDFGTLKAISFFVRNRGNVNYTANDEFCPTICSGDDIHTYYLPDELIKQRGKQLLSLLNEGVQDSGNLNGVSSLEGLRKDLTWLYPAMETIYTELAAERDEYEPLLGDPADILYVWCSMCYAAREPIYSEDGPMNCFWDHPETVPEWEREMRKYAEIRKQKWLDDHKNDIDNDCEIIIKDRKYVFSGTTSNENWLGVFEAFINQGGVHRNAVSGQTDYVVCDPYNAGDSPIQAVKQQRLKGRCLSTKIILYDRFCEALGIPYSQEPGKAETVESSLEYDNADAEQTAIRTETVAPIISLTFDKHIIAHGTSYKVEIPDAFVVKGKTDDRDFIAWQPNDEAPAEWEKSNFVIFAGQKFPGDIFESFCTAEEFEELCRVVSDQSASTIEHLLFEDTRIIPNPNSKFPGVIMIMYTRDALHAHILGGMKNAIQMIRVQIGGVERKNRKAYDAVIKGIAEHITPDDPVSLIKQPDDPGFLKANLTNNWLTEWKELINERIAHYAALKDTSLQMVKTQFEKKENQNSEDVRALKQDFQQILKRTGRRFEDLLSRCESVYLEMKRQYPDHQDLNSIYDILEEVASLTSHSLTINGDENNKIVYTSRFGKKLSDRVGGKTETVKHEETTAKKVSNSVETNKKVETPNESVESEGTKNNTLADHKKASNVIERAEAKGSDDNTRISIGEFFTVKAFSGLILANVNQDEYKDGDTITTLFDTTGGRTPEMGILDGIQNGLKIRLGRRISIDDEQLQKLNEAIKREKHDKDRQLKNAQGIIVRAFSIQEDGETGYIYYIITNKGILNAIGFNLTQEEVNHFDSLFSSAIPGTPLMNDTTNEVSMATKAEKKLEVKDQTKEQEIWRVKGQHLTEEFEKSIQRRNEEASEEHRRKQEEISIHGNYEVYEVRNMVNGIKSISERHGRDLERLIRNFDQEAKGVLKNSEDVFFAETVYKAINKTIENDLNISMSINLGPHGNLDYEFEISKDILEIAEWWRKKKNDLIARKNKKDTSSTISKTSAGTPSLQQKLQAQWYTSRILPVAKSNVEKIGRFLSEKQNQLQAESKRIETLTAQANEEVRRANEVLEKAKVEKETVKARIPVLKEEERQKQLRIQAIDSELSSLGFFAFGRKKELRAEKETILQRIKSIQDEIQYTGVEERSIMRRAEEKADEIRRRASGRIDNELRTAREQVRRLQEETGKLTKEKEKANETLRAVESGEWNGGEIKTWEYTQPKEAKQQIRTIQSTRTSSKDDLEETVIQVLACARRPMTVTEMIDEDVRLCDKKPQEVSRVVRKLMIEGRIVREEYKNKAVFRLS